MKQNTHVIVGIICTLYALVLLTKYTCCAGHAESTGGNQFKILKNK
jgi:hypothetical protein